MLARYKSMNERRCKTKEHVVNKIFLNPADCRADRCSCTGRQSDNSTLPGGSNWYIHVNLDLIRNSEVGQQLMQGTMDEALEESGMNWVSIFVTRFRA